jgi:hypothetical protein
MLDCVLVRCVLMRRIGLTAGAWILLQLATAPVWAIEPLTGRSVAQVLDEAIRDGARIIYSSERVPPELRVFNEPDATDPFTRLNQVLAPHGLTLKSTAPNVWVVVRASEASDVERTNTVPELEGRSAEVDESEVTVTGSRYTLSASAAGSSLALATSDIQTQPAMFDDALRSIRRFPGTASTPYSSHTHVRGGDDIENLVVLDGVYLSEPYRLQGLPADFSLIDPAIVSKVEFYSGVFPPEFGGRMSSVTHLRTRHATRPFGGRLEVSLINASALLEGQLPRDDSDWMIAVRRGTLDLLARALEPDFGRPHLLDLFASLRWKLNASSALSFGVLSADDNVDLEETDRSEAITAESDRTHLWINFETSWRDARVVTRIAHNLSNLERSGLLVDEEVAGALTDNRSVRAWKLSQDGSLPIRQSLLRWGWSVEDMDVSYDYRKSTDFAPEIIGILGSPPPDFATQRDSGARGLAAYAAAEWMPVERLTVDLGARWERQQYDTRQHAAHVDPRVSLLYRITERVRARIAWGQLTQFASGAELPVERGTTRYDSPARASLWVLALDCEPARDQLLRIELYDKRVSDPWPRLESLLNPLVLVPELRPDQVLVLPRSASSTGIDIHWFGRFTQRWRGWLSYSNSRTLEQFASGDVPPGWDQRHALALGLTTDRWGWTWTAAVTAHSGWPTTAVILSPATGVSLGSRNSSHLSWYGTLDLKAQRLFALNRGMLRMSAELANVTGRGNACCSALDFEDDEESSPPVKVENKSWFPLVPFLEIAWEF